MGSSLDALDPDLRQGAQELLNLCGEAGLLPSITSTVRTYREQKFLWDRYIAGASSGLPAAPPGHSAHEYGWAFDMIVSPMSALPAVGRAWVKYWGGGYGGKRDPVHFELPGAGKLAYTLGEQGAQPSGIPTPEIGGAFYKLADFFSGWLPVLGEVQLADTLAKLLDHHEDIATWYLQHPAEAIRDLLEKLRGT